MELEEALNLAIFTLRPRHTNITDFSKIGLFNVYILFNNYN